MRQYAFSSRLSRYSEAFWISVCLRKDGVLFPYDGEPVRYREFVPSELSAV
jgi:hypothetical protein